MAESVSPTTRTEAPPPAETSALDDGHSFVHKPLAERVDWALSAPLPSETRVRIMQWLFAGEPSQRSMERLREFRQAADADTWTSKLLDEFVWAGNTAVWSGTAHLRGLWLVDRLNHPDMDEATLRQCVSDIAKGSASIVLSLHLVQAQRRPWLMDALRTDGSGLQALAFNAGGSATVAAMLLDKLPGLIGSLTRLGQLKLDFKGVALTTEQVKQIGKLPVTSLTLSNCGLTNAHLAALLPCPTVKVLDLSRNSLVSVQWLDAIGSRTPEFAKLEQHPAIVSLSLAECRLGGGIDVLSLPALLWLNDMASLRVLDVRACGLGDAAIEGLAALPLTSLRLDDNQCREQGARALGQSTTLRNVSVRGMALKGLVGLIGAAPALQHIDAGRNKVGLAGLDPLLASTSLKSVVLDGNLLGDGAATRLSANSWQVLDVSYNDIELAGANALVGQASDQLKALNLRGNPLPPNSYESLNEHPAVRRHALPG